MPAVAALPCDGDTPRDAAAVVHQRDLAPPHSIRELRGFRYRRKLVLGKSAGIFVRQSAGALQRLGNALL